MRPRASSDREAVKHGIRRRRAALGGDDGNVIDRSVAAQYRLVRLDVTRSYGLRLRPREAAVELDALRQRQRLALRVCALGYVEIVVFTAVLRIYPFEHRAEIRAAHRVCPR